MSVFRIRALKTIPHSMEPPDVSRNPSVTDQQGVCAAIRALSPPVCYPPSGLRVMCFISRMSAQEAFEKKVYA